MWDNLTDPVTLRLTGDDPPVALADAMHQAWVAFITHGEPGHAGLPPWPRYSSPDHEVLEFDLEPVVLHDPYREERALWEGACVTAVTADRDAESSSGGVAAIDQV